MLKNILLVGGFNRMALSRLMIRLMSLLLIMLAAQTASAIQPRLPGMNALPDQTSISGLSSGAFMASQFHVAYSKDLVGAAIIAERIRENIAALSMSIDKTGKNRINVTISIGGSCSSSCKDPNELITQADKVLYCAKNSGRNRVELSVQRSTVEDENRTQRNLQVTRDLSA